MAEDTPKISPDDIPMGATLRPLYMGRVMNTYPVSDSEMEKISSLNGQITARFSVASFLLALAAGIWTAYIFTTEMTPAGTLASYYVAPLLLLFAIGYSVAGLVARHSRNSEWNRIKDESVPVQSMSAATPMIAQERQG